MVFAFDNLMYITTYVCISFRVFNCYEVVVRSAVCISADLSISLRGRGGGATTFPKCVSQLQALHAKRLATVFQHTRCW